MSDTCSQTKDWKQTLSEMPPAKDKAALQRFLGMINYQVKFIPNLSEQGCGLELAAPATGHISQAQNMSHQSTCYVQKPVTLICDASQHV